jgi:hypothetical protein
MKGVERNRRCKQEREEPKLSEAEDLWLHKNPWTPYVSSLHGLAIQSTEHLPYIYIPIRLPAKGRGSKSTKV